jgi:hypothetical protein
MYVRTYACILVWSSMCMYTYTHRNMTMDTHTHTHTSRTHKSTELDVLPRLRPRICARAVHSNLRFCIPDYLCTCMHTYSRMYVVSNSVRVNIHARWPVFRDNVCVWRRISLRVYVCSYKLCPAQAPSCGCTCCSPDLEVTRENVQLYTRV